MTILNFPDNPAAVDNIYVAPNGVTYLYDGVKWSGQTLVGNTPIIDLGAVEQDIIPSSDNTYDLGSPDKTWKHIYAASGSIYLGDIKLTNDDGTFVATQVTNPGAVNEAPVGPTGNSLSIPTDISDLTDNENLLGSGGGPTGPTGPSGFNNGSLSITGSVIHSNTNVSISSGMGDQTNWVMSINANTGSFSSPENGHVNSVAYDSEGNVFATGGYGVDGSGSQGMFLIKTDPNGQVLFHNYYNEYYSFGYAMAVDKNDDVVFVMGEYDTSSTDSLLVKVSGVDGTFIWQKYLADTDPSSDDVAICVDIDPRNNDVIIAGNTATNSNYDFWIAKFSSANGSPIWQRQYDQETLYDVASGLAVDSQGNIGIVGWSYGGEQGALPVFKLSGVDGSVLWQTKIIAATSDMGDAWIDGNFMSADMCVDSNDDFYFNLTGVYCYPYDTVAGLHKVSGSDGKLLWGKVITYTGYQNAASSIICDDEDNVYAHSMIWNYRQVNEEAGWYPRWTINVTKLNTTGSRMWSRSLIREQGNVAVEYNDMGPYNYFGQCISVRDDYVLIGGVQYLSLQYPPYDEWASWSQGYDHPVIAQVNRDGTEFNVDGWRFANTDYFLFTNITLFADVDNYYLNDLTNVTPDIDVTPGDVYFESNTDTTSLSYVSRSRVKTLTLEGSTLMLPENGTLEITRAKKGYITAIGGFDGDEGGNTDSAVWLYAAERDEKGNTFASGGQYRFWWYDDYSHNTAMTYKTDNEGNLKWQVALPISAYTETFSIAYDQTNNTVVSLSTDGAEGSIEFPVSAGFIVAYMDADTGSMKQDLTHIKPGPSDGDIYPTVVRLMSDGTPVVGGYVNNAYDTFSNVTEGAAGLTGSDDVGTLVILKSRFDRDDSTYSIEYPKEDGSWYIGDSVINHVNHYGDDEILADGVIYTGTLGSGATFDVTVSGGAWTGIAIVAGGSGYKPGQKVKILGTALGGTTPTNDLYLFVDTVNGSGAITDLTGDTIASAIPADGGPYTAVATTAIAGTGLNGWVKIDPATDAYTFTKTSNGNNYGVGDTFKILGSNLGGTNVTNDMTITVTAINGTGNGYGAVDTFTVSGTPQNVRIKLHINNETDFTQTGTYNVYHELNDDGFVWTPTWDFSFGSSENNSYDTVNGIAIDSNDDVIFSGYAELTGLDGNTTNDGNAQTGFISKHNNAGVNLWTVSIDGSEGASTVWSVDTDSDDNIYSAMCNDYEESLFVTKLSPSGEFIWQTSVNMDNSSDAWSIGVTDNNDVIVVGQGYNNQDLNNDYRNDNDNIYIFKFDLDGNLLFSRLLWSNSGIRTNYNDAISNTLSIKGNRFSIAAFSNNPGGNDYQGIIVDLPIDGTGIGKYGDFYYDEVEVSSYRFEDNDNNDSNLLVTPITLVSRSHIFISEPYVDGDAWRNTTQYDSRPHEIQTIYEPGGGDIRGVNKIVFEDGTEQTTTGQGLPQVKMSQVNTGGVYYDEYWVRLEDNGKHIYTIWDDAGVIIPDRNRLDIPVGFAFTIITSDNSSGVYSWDEDENIYGSGFDGDNDYSWSIPSFSMVTLVKIADGRWMIAGPGITTGWW